MSPETVEVFRRTLKRALDTEIMIERLRQANITKEAQTLQSVGLHASNANSWSKRKAFDQMDWLNKAYITVIEVQ
jgi:hypothetical protein